eukprot:3369680-Pleurochrysis_carterae.AAC.1
MHCKATLHAQRSAAAPVIAHAILKCPDFSVPARAATSLHKGSMPTGSRSKRSTTTSSHANHDRAPALMLDCGSETILKIEYEAICLLKLHTTAHDNKYSKIHFAILDIH